MCRGILGPRPKDKEQRLKEADEKKAAERQKPAKTTTGIKRKFAETGSGAGRQVKKRRLLTPKSIRAGVKKAVSKATAARGKTAAKETIAAKTGRGKAATKKDVKLPAVRGAARVKATVRQSGKKRGDTKATSTSQARTTKLKRPSAETKRQILAAASKGSRSPAQKSPAKAQASARSPRKTPTRKAPSKSPVKARMAPSKGRSATAPSSPAKAKAAKDKSLSGRVRSAARNVARSVKGTKK